MRALIARATAAAAAVLAVPSIASAHAATVVTARTTWRSWHLDPLAAIAVILATWLYLRGTAAIWGKAGAGRGIPRWRVWAYCAGMASIAFALWSPLDDASNQLLAAHMLQHMVLILVSAPLLDLGAPVGPFAAALPRAWRPRVSSVSRTIRRSFLAPLANPFGATLTQAVVFWLWHLPGPYESALRHDSIHAIEHFSMLLTAVLFWWAVIPRLGRRSERLGVSVLAVVLAGMQSGVLGALLTFSGDVWYPAYAGRAALWRLSPIEDQQLAGLAMWIPGGLVYLGTALALLALWLESDERQADLRCLRAPTATVEGEA
jgi:putative membrane protein